VKIFCTRQNPNYAIPWQTSDILAGTGIENFLIEKKTNKVLF
jgi:hypothetical protein